MIEIGMNNLQRVLPLYIGWEHHMSLHAAAEGKANAEVWADCMGSPRAAAVCFGYRMLIGGNPEDIHCRQEISSFFHDIVLLIKLIRLTISL